MAPPTLIYCGGGNPSLAEIAVNAGFKYGSQLPETTYYPLYFADQDWKNPDRARYMQELAQHKPYMATVLDLERPSQLTEVLSWAEEAAQHVQTVLVIPKYNGAIAHLPRTIGGKPIRLAYSVPTRFGGTEVPTWEFTGWPVHLLGGAPHKQKELTHYLNVVSVDGNMHQKIALQFCAFWTPGTARYAKNRFWPSIKEANGGKPWPGENAHHEAFRRSCVNIVQYWNHPHA